jgi:hypothetical protein
MAMLSPEELVVHVKPYLPLDAKVSSHTGFYYPHARPPSLLAFRYSTGIEPDAALRAIADAGILLSVEHGISPGGPLFPYNPHLDDGVGLGGYFSIRVMRSKKELRTYVSGRSRPTDAAALNVTTIPNGPQLGDGVDWFRCDLPPHPRDQMIVTAEHGDHVRWSRGLLAFELKVSQPPDVNLAGFMEIARNIDAFEAMLPPFALPAATVPAPATEAERLAALARITRLLDTSGLTPEGDSPASRYVRPSTEYVLKSEEPAAELRRVDLLWERVAEIQTLFKAEGRTVVAAVIVED